MGSRRISLHLPHPAKIIMHCPSPGYEQNAHQMASRIESNKQNDGDSIVIQYKSIK